MNSRLHLPWAEFGTLIIAIVSLCYQIFKDKK